ncbi:CBS domain-containing protein [Streptomyces yangpuensis]|uniref:CBS domain-containing protein n=1 Tax=Streptomyces yangpuensis TaxID=1648182 RepID=UPI0037FB2F80
MTLVQMQPRSACPKPVHRTVDDAIDAAGPQVCDDMTVEVALAVMSSARTDRLLVCDEDGLCSGLVTLAQLATIRDSSAYTDQVRLRAVIGERGPCVTSSRTTVAEAEHAMRYRGLDALPVVDEQGSAPGVLARAR